MVRGAISDREVFKAATKSALGKTLETLDGILDLIWVVFLEGLKLGWAWGRPCRGARSHLGSVPEAGGAERWFLLPLSCFVNAF